VSPEPARGLRQRSSASELMETDCVDFADYRRCLHDLTRVNRITLTHRPTLAWLRRAAADLASFSLLDVGCGEGDFLRLALRWARRAGKSVRLGGIDRHPWSIRAAQAATPANDPVTYVAADVFAWQPPEAFDFIVSSQFLHHLTDEQAAAFLAWQDRTAARGWLVADIERHWFAYWGFPLLARLARWHRLVRIDGQISIARGWRPAELQALAVRAGIPGAVVRRHPPFRLTLSRLP
jgi:2-polyprenyl-3-methyl-5-hydroxy-6-metoxy-1,4-benzoquinol methylase